MSVVSAGRRVESPPHRHGISQGINIHGHDRRAQLHRKRKMKRNGDKAMTSPISIQDVSIQIG